MGDSALNRCGGFLESNHQQRSDSELGVVLKKDGFLSPPGSIAAVAEKSESPCPFIVRQILDELVDDDEDPELKTTVQTPQQTSLNLAVCSTIATPSADSGFGGGASSPPPGTSNPNSSNGSTTASSSCAGGDSPAPSIGGTPSTPLAGGYSSFVAQPLPQNDLNDSLKTSCSGLGSLFCPSATRGIGPFTFGSSNRCSTDQTVTDPNSMDMKMLEQAVQLVQMGIGVPPPENPVGPGGDHGDFSLSDHSGGFGRLLAASGDSDSNFANNLRALASLENNQVSMYSHNPASPENRYSLPVYNSRQNQQKQHQQHPDLLNWQKLQQQQMMMKNHLQLQRYNSQPTRCYNQDDSRRFGAVSPPHFPLQQFNNRPASNNFRGSSGSLCGEFGMNWSGDSNGLNNPLVGISRLEMNKGGLGKNPYAGFLDACSLPGVSSDPMQIRCKFGQLGQGQGQFNSPHGFCLGRSEEIVVADTHNHRIQIFDKAGNFKFMFGNQGKAEGCLWYPRKVAVLKHNGNFVVCDRGGERSRMQIFNQYGQFSHAISIRFIDIVAGLAVSHDGHIVAVDSVTPTIFILSESGNLIRYHECSEFMKEPSDIGIYDRNYYICDFKDHNVVVVSSEDGKLLRKIGNDRVTCFPNGIDISDAGDVLIGDSHGNKFHVAVYDRDGCLASQFECPNVKVSRCCGLKITSEGYIVTLAKNNHHVLVLNTIYIC